MYYGKRKKKEALLMRRKKQLIELLRLMWRDPKVDEYIRTEVKGK